MVPSAAIADLDKKVVSATRLCPQTKSWFQRQIMSTDEKLVSATRIFYITNDGVPPANQSTSKKLPHHNETNMVSTRKLAEMQKQK
jgi:hypothetical protein